MMLVTNHRRLLRLTRLTTSLKQIMAVLWMIQNLCRSAAAGVSAAVSENAAGGSTAASTVTASLQCTSAAAEPRSATARAAGAGFATASGVGEGRSIWSWLFFPSFAAGTGHLKQAC